MRPTKEEIQRVRENFKLWSWLERQRGALRAIEEAENISLEDELFLLVEFFIENEVLADQPSRSRLGDQMIKMGK